MTLFPSIYSMLYYILLSNGSEFFSKVYITCFAFSLSLKLTRKINKIRSGDNSRIWEGNDD